MPAGAIGTTTRTTGWPTRGRLTAPAARVQHPLQAGVPRLPSPADAQSPSRPDLAPADGDRSRRAAVLPPRLQPIAAPTAAYGRRAPRGEDPVGTSAG